MNRWNIPDWLEREVIFRDRKCIYCGVPFEPGPQSRGAKPTWEHIINDARMITRENIALCCSRCNASKGQKQLSAWLQSRYCKERGITPDTVAPIVKQAIVNGQ